ncbi:MAG TPA: dihydrofolate reductase family protein [Spirochaetota bacterium]
MRKIIVAMQVTLDGFIEGPKGELDWAMKEDAETWKEVFELHDSADTLLLGRVMYPAFEKYWLSVLSGRHGSENEIAYAKRADKMQKLLFSTTVSSVEWETTRIIKDNVEGEMRKMKQQSGKNMLMLGGAGLVSSFMNSGLVDEIHLLINPVILGGGKPLFGNLNKRERLHLISSKILASGKVAVHYHLAEC